MANYSRGDKNNSWKGGPQSGTCANCGASFLAPRWKLKSRRFCSKVCAAKSTSPKREKSHLWNGGRHIFEGRVLVLAVDNPRANKRGYVFEHILVAEMRIGRRLLPQEVVHHINGISHDNRPENLLVCKDQAHHMRVHAEDRIRRMGGDPALHKICGQCGNIKAREEFYPAQERGDFLRYNCKSCQSVYAEMLNSKQRGKLARKETVTP